MVIIIPTLLHQLLNDVEDEDVPELAIAFAVPFADLVSADVRIVVQEYLAEVAAVQDGVAVDEKFHEKDSALFATGWAAEGLEQEVVWLAKLVGDCVAVDQMRLAGLGTATKHHRVSLASVAREAQHVRKVWASDQDDKNPAHAAWEEARHQLQLLVAALPNPNPIDV